MKLSNSNTLLINSYYNNIWCDPYNYTNIIKQDYLIKKYLKNILLYKYNDLVIKKSQKKTTYILYINPDFNNKSNISINSIFKILNELFNNYINLKVIKVAKLKWINKEIKQIDIIKYNKLINLIISLIKYWFDQELNFNIIKQNIQNILKNSQVLGYIIIINGIFKESSMAQQKKIIWGKISLGKYINNIYFKKSNMNLSMGTFGIKVYININII